MKQLLMTGVALAILTGGALAQSAAPPPPAPAGVLPKAGVMVSPPSSPAQPGLKAPRPPIGGPDAGIDPGAADGPGAMVDDAGSPPPPPPGGPRGRRPPPGGPDAMDDEGPGGPPPHGPKGHRPPPPPSRAAHFHLETGSMTLDIKCAEDQPTKECGDLVLQMLDKLQGLPKP